MTWGAEAVLAPAGILEVDTDQLSIIFGTSRDTSDFVADCLESWWEERKSVHPGIRRLQIDLDNGPEIASNRTQFMRRLVEFSDLYDLEIELVYYSPYHSKYNRIERCWGILESHWNGAILSSVQVAMNWAATMTWRGVAPIVELIEGVYERGVTITRSAYRPILARLDKAKTLSKWSVRIQAQPVGY